METVKTYSQVNKNDKSLSFGISKMEDIYEKRKGKIDAPHRHDYFTVILTTKAKGKHIIDFNSYELSNNQIFFISPGQVHQITENQKSYGYSIVFSTPFLIANNIPVSFIDDLNLFNDFGASDPLVLTDDELFLLSKYAQEILTVYDSDIMFKTEAIGALLKLILIRCNNLCALPKNKHHESESGNVTLRSFKLLVNQNHMTWHATSNYANALNVSSDHLNRVLKSLTGKTTKEHIQSRLIVAAKRLLYFSELSNKEIGYKLGFSEPGNFSAFFKKCTGLAPSKFKK